MTAAATHHHVPDPGSEMLSIEEAAQLLRVPVNTLRNWRQLGAGPRSFKVGRHVRYWHADLVLWLSTARLKAVPNCQTSERRWSHLGRSTLMAGNIAKRPNGKWRARYRDDAGRERSRHFDRKIDAQQWLDRIAASLVTDTYVDPDAGKVTFQQFYDDWSARQVWAPTTVVAMKLATGSTGFADLPLRSIRRSHVEAWVKQMHASGLAPGTIKTRVNNARAVFKAAHRDRIIGSDPTQGVVLPRLRRSEHSMRIPSPRTSAGSCARQTHGSGPLSPSVPSLGYDLVKPPRSSSATSTSSAGS